MATVTIVLTDHGPDDFVMRVESEPPFELENDEPVLDDLTAAQAAAFFVAHTLSTVTEDVDFRTLARDRGWGGGA